MINAQTVLSGMMGEIGEAPQARSRIWTVFGMLLMALVGLAGLIASFWIFALAALHGWQTGNWERLDNAATLAIPLLVLLLIALLVPIGVQSSQRTRRDARRFSEIFAQQHVRTTPLAPYQPRPLSPEELAAIPVSFEHLRPFVGISDRRARRSGLIILVSIYLFLVVMLFLMVLGTQETWRPFGLSFLESSSVWIMLGCILPLSFLSFIVTIIVGVVSVIRKFAVPHERPSIAANDLGLTWRPERGQPERHAPWSSVRAFVQAGYTVTFAQTTFLLETDTGVFAWPLGINATPQERAESDQLARLVVQRSGQPLRDLTALLDAIKWARTDTTKLKGLGLSDEAIAGLAQMRRHAGRSLLAFVSILLLIVLLFVLTLGTPLIASNRLQAAQQAYWAGLAPKITAQAPTFSDSLAHDDTIWPVSVSKEDIKQNGFFGYVGGSYQMYGQRDYAYWAPTDVSAGDAAVAVTVRETGDASAVNGNDGVGVLLRANADASEYIVFYVTPTTGEWTLQHYKEHPGQADDNNWNWMDDGSSSAIARGMGVANRLLVVMRGQTYLMYVNGQLVDAYTPSDYDTQQLPAYGATGLFLNDGIVTGVYTNFAIYPVQSSPSLGYVPGDGMPAVPLPPLLPGQSSY